MRYNKWDSNWQSERIACECARKYTALSTIVEGENVHVVIA